MSNYYKYSMAKLFYGLFILWYGINLINKDKIKENSKYLGNSFEIFKLFGNSTDYGKYINNKIKNYISEIPIKKNANEIVHFIGLLLIIGGFFAACGYKISSYIIMFGLLMDLCFIHNLIYYSKEPMKINVLKIFCLIGGCYFIC